MPASVVEWGGMEPGPPEDVYKTDVGKKVGMMTVRGYVLALGAVLCACLLAFAAPGCRRGAPGDRPPDTIVVPDNTSPAGAPLPGDGHDSGQEHGQGGDSDAGGSKWRTQVWRIWPGTPRLEYEGAGCFVGGFVSDAMGKPACLLLSPAALGSDAPAMLVVAPSATGEWRTVGRLEDARDYHWAGEGNALVGVEGARFFSLTTDGKKTVLYESDDLIGADLLPAGRGVLITRRGAGGDTLCLALADEKGLSTLVGDIADMPPEPELVSRPLVPCRVSADGSRAAICAWRGGAAAVFVVDLVSGATTPLPLSVPGAPEPASIPGPAVWAPQGDYLAVPGHAVYSMPRGESVVTLGGGDTSPVWSVDGKYLLTGDAIVAIPEGTRVALADLIDDLCLPPSAQVRPLGWARVPPRSGQSAPGAIEGAGAFVVASWPAEG
ncbi:MAG: hypothetical protein K6T75_02620 [Acetobacteraceae bacterium]|nr:hypothetical protein [Acetobacteraceae bacterium]